MESAYEEPMRLDEGIGTQNVHEDSLELNEGMSVGMRTVQQESRKVDHGGGQSGGKIADAAGGGSFLGYCGSVLSQHDVFVMTCEGNGDFSRLLDVLRRLWCPYAWSCPYLSGKVTSSPWCLERW